MKLGLAILKLSLLGVVSLCLSVKGDEGSAGFARAFQSALWTVDVIDAHDQIGRVLREIGPETAETSFAPIFSEALTLPGKANRLHDVHGGGSIDFEMKKFLSLVDDYRTLDQSDVHALERIDQKSQAYAKQIISRSHNFEYDTAPTLAVVAAVMAERLFARFAKLSVPYALDSIKTRLQSMRQSSRSNQTFQRQELPFGVDYYLGLSDLIYVFEHSKYDWGKQKNILSVPTDLRDRIRNLPFRYRNVLFFTQSYEKIRNNSEDRELSEIISILELSKYTQPVR